MSSRRGVIAFIVMLVVLGGAVLYLAWGRKPAMQLPSSTVLVFDVPYRLPEDQPRIGEGAFGFVPRERLTVWTLIHGLHRAAKDDNVKALVLHFGATDWGWGALSEVRDAIQAFRAAGKPVYASMAGATEREYFLASAAGTIAAPPIAVLQLDGLALSALFLRGTLDKLGVSPNFMQIGRYKSGAETFTREGMSEPMREALDSLLTDTYRILCDTLSGARGVTPEWVASALEEGPYTAVGARDAGLIDTLLYEADVDSLALVAAGDASPLKLERYLDRIGDGPLGSRLALVVASGTIASGRSRSAPGGNEILGSETLIKTLREVRERESIKAVVLRIDSPGGSSDASDEIWREVARCAEVKPVIASLSNVAASGGYYIAVGADSIVSHPATITGSIGVYGGKLNILGLYRKIGLNVETLARGRHALMLSPYSDFSEEEAQAFRGQMEEVYRRFVARVAYGREMTSESVDSVAQGRVWSGRSASELGLIDAWGGIPRALEMARARAGLDPDRDMAVEVYPKTERTLLQSLLAELWSDGEDQLAHIPRLQFQLPPELTAWLALAELAPGAGLALLPFTIRID